MAICNIAEDPTQSTERFEQIQAHLRGTGPVPPEGARLVLAGQANPGRRVITVWDSREARDVFFAERLGPAYESAGCSFERVEHTEFEVDMLVAGDLTGMPEEITVAEGR
jgi:hypothetical protein